MKKVKWITKGKLTMDKWDLLTVILRDNDLVDLLNTIYEQTDETKNMKETIKHAAL